MKKKLFLTLFIAVIILLLSVSYVFANNKVVEDIRNTVGDTENMVEDAGKGVAQGVRNITNAGENAMENMATDVNNYTATRTSADMTTNSFLGMTATTWTWLIMGIVGIAIVALVWIYGKQYANNSYNDNNY